MVLDMNCIRPNMSIVGARMEYNSSFLCSPWQCHRWLNPINELLHLLTGVLGDHIVTNHNSFYFQGLGSNIFKYRYINQTGSRKAEFIPPIFLCRRMLCNLPLQKWTIFLFLDGFMIFPPWPVRVNSPTDFIWIIKITD